MIDICTVVFREELPLLKLQAQSLALYAQDIGIKNIYIIVNDDSSVGELIDFSWYGNLDERVVVIPRQAFGADYVENGWVSQQALKMMAAAMSYNTWTMILDAKTILTRPLDLSELFDGDRMQAGTLPIYPVFEPSQQIVNDLFGIKLTEQIGPGGVPFFVNNSVVRGMIADVESRTGQSFPAWFQAQGMVTEFMLYSGYVQSKKSLRNKLYSKKCKFNVINVCHSEVDQFENKLDLFNPQTLSVSIHRKAWTQLSDLRREKYRNLLIDCKIIQAQLL